jgi:hypothetical protein
MAQRVRVKLNLPVLLKHLSRERGSKVTAIDAYKWLREAGFKRHGPCWVVKQADLGHLDPSEVAEVLDIGPARDR